MLHTLNSAPVLGVSMGNVALLRLDRTGGPAPGNKSFKLAGYLDRARRLGVSRLVSFGGAWSNHLHALAASGYQHGLETVGIVRGEAGDDTAMLADARRWGMRIVQVGRAEYRLRNDADYLRDIAAQFDPCVLVPEGGASTLGARGCAAIAALISHSAPQAERIVLPVGTGTTLAGLAVGLDERYEVIGISALKGVSDLCARVQALLDDLSASNCARWRILHDFHCGGFARVDAPLRAFMLEFEAVQGIQLDPVYTGKMIYGIHQLYRRGEWDPAIPLVALHTGGLQGRRGYDWLTSM